MKSINIYLLCQIDDPETFRDYANILSRRAPTRSVREAEQGSLHALVRDLSEKRLRYRSYDYFFYSFNIRHIGKEFDLLKIKKDHSLILNIELKSEMVGEARIRKQLMQNRYYLSHITRNIRSYTYVSSDGTIYTLDEADNLTTCGIDTLREELRDDTDWMTDDIESLFDAGDYLISPTRTPQRFLDQQYFLTQQQETYKAQIRTAVAEFTENAASALFLGISGSPGTGKTLLLYDLASSLRNEYRVCVIHCGRLLPGHFYLREHGWDIVGIREMGDAFSFERYDVLLIDETQRIYQKQFNILREAAEDLGLVCICTYDPRQVLLASEMRRNISLQLENIAAHTFKLSEKIRANKELDSFMRVLLESNITPDRCTYENIDVLYARSEKECDSFKSNYMNRGYTFINFQSGTPSPAMYEDEGSEQSAHRVIGQEYDSVIMILDEKFYYDGKGVLRAEKHPNPDYLYDQLLYQGITRTREKLCLIIVRNIGLFTRINEMIRGRYG